MENLTNEQIVDIINFYKLCGISEDMYLSEKGVLDLFTLLGIVPKYDDEGNRMPTVYEQLEIAPVFRDGKEVPIVFAIKHKVKKIFKGNHFNGCTNFVYKGVSKKKSDMDVLNQLKRNYFSAIANGNMSEATRIYDVIDLMTGGKADFFISIQFNCVKFYKKMQKQLLIDMFANFVILMILSKKPLVKEGVVKLDKLYKSFVKEQLSFGGFGYSSGSAPKLSNVTISLGGDDGVQKLTVKAHATKNEAKVEENISQEVPPQETKNQENIISYVKSKISRKLSHLKEHFTRKLDTEKTIDENKEDLSKPNSEKSDRTLNILEND